MFSNTCAMTPAPITAHMSNFDPIPRLQQIAATIEDGGRFDSPATAAHYINCAIREIERLRQEYGEARRAIGESLQTLIHLRQEQNTLKAALEEARLEVCECRSQLKGRNFTPMQIAEQRGWPDALAALEETARESYKGGD